MNRALKKYIQLIISEVVDNPRAPQQLMTPEKSSHKDEDEKDSEEKEVEEISTVAGSLVPGGGFTALHGLSGKDVEGPGAKGQRKKRKSPGWS